MAFDDDLRLTLVIADQVDSMTTRAFNERSFEVDTKPDTTLVTDADREAERIVRAQLQRTRPRMQRSRRGGTRPQREKHTQPRRRR